MAARRCPACRRSTAPPRRAPRSRRRRSTRRCCASCSSRRVCRSRRLPPPRNLKAMEPWSFELAGRFDEHAFESKVLEGNALGDPHVRPLWVYVPPGYDDDPERRYPSIYVIQGLTGQLDGWRNRTPFRKNFPELVDELFAKDDSPPALLVWVDAWTSL